MNTRNDVSMVKEIPIELGKFNCGWWGRHQPPYIKEGKIIFDVGVGYKSNNHLHGQNLYVIDAYCQEKMALIEVRKYGDLYGAGHWMYLTGINSIHAWICQVPVTLESVIEAVEYLKPAAVKHAEEAGLKVVRQGDWFFIPVSKPGHGTSVVNHPLDDDHFVDLMVCGRSANWVVGEVCHDQQATIFLDTWHKAIRNKAIRFGRFGQGKDAD